MGGFRKQEDRRQGLLLPPSPSDWLPEGHLAWFVIDAVDQLGILRELERPRLPDDAVVVRGGVASVVHRK